MESPSAPTRRGYVPCQGLLLAVSLLIFWSPSTTTQVTVLSVSVPEGKDVVLPILNKPRDVAAFLWYRGIGENDSCLIALNKVESKIYASGLAYSSRETILYDGSLLIENVLMKDTGIYTLVAYRSVKEREIRFRRLHVYQHVREPTIQANNTTVTENKDAAVLTCCTNETSVQWLFNGGNLKLTERMKLSQDSRTLTIDPIRREDAGNYQCEVSNPYSFLKSVPLMLKVE